MIRLNKVDRYYKTSGKVIHALKEISLCIKQKDMVAIMGPSGSGKSSLVNVLGFIDTDFQGEYLFKNQLFNEASDSSLAKLRNRSVGFVFQNFNLIENNTIFENVALPLLYNKHKEQDIKKLTLKMLTQVGLQGKENNYPKHLSGGQQQRVAIARALINKPEFIIADEPTGSLDSKTAVEIMNIFREVNLQQGTTIILVTHNPDLVSYCNRLIRIKDGYIVEDKVL